MPRGHSRIIYIRAAPTWFEHTNLPATPFYLEKGFILIARRQYLLFYYGYESAFCSTLQTCLSIPLDRLDACKTAVFTAVAGCLGEYTQCCWTAIGTGQFLPGDTAQPYIGQAGELWQVQEARVETLCVGEEVARKAVAALKE